jgi:hypothetical protein
VTTSTCTCTPRSTRRTQSGRRVSIFHTSTPLFYVEVKYWGSTRESFNVQHVQCTRVLRVRLYDVEHSYTVGGMPLCTLYSIIYTSMSYSMRRRIKGSRKDICSAFIYFDEKQIFRNDHTTMTAPLPVCSAKLSIVGPG